MSIEMWLAYCAAVLVLTASPGPSSLLCVTKGATQGFHAAVLTALGSLTAITGILSLSFTGLGLVIASSDLVFTAIKYIGAAYLIYLGVQAFRSNQNSFEIDETRIDVPQQKWYQHYFSGFVVGASNPKAILFFTALFPQFINPEVAMWSQYLTLASTFVVMELSWLLIYGRIGAVSTRWLLSEGRAKLFNRLTGSVFVGAGVLMTSVNR